MHIRRPVSTDNLKSTLGKMNKDTLICERVARTDAI